MTMTPERKEYLYNYHKEKLHRIPLNVTKEEYERIKQAADTAGESVNGFIKKAILARIEKEEP